MDTAPACGRWRSLGAPARGRFGWRWPRSRWRCSGSAWWCSSGVGDRGEERVSDCGVRRLPGRPVRDRVGPPRSGVIVARPGCLTAAAQASRRGREASLEPGHGFGRPGERPSSRRARAGSRSGSLGSTRGQATRSGHASRGEPTPCRPRDPLALPAIGHLAQARPTGHPLGGESRPDRSAQAPTTPGLPCRPPR